MIFEIRVALGEFNENGELIGIYPHYVFKKNEKGEYISDGGMTFGYGHWISPKLYDDEIDAKNLIDTYAYGADIIPDVISINGTPVKVENSTSVPIDVVDKLFREDIKKGEEVVNTFLYNNNIKLQQHQFDALVSFTHQYGISWWEMDKVLPNFIKKGEGTYNPEDVRDVFLMHSDKERRAVEAEVFINGYLE